MNKSILIALRYLFSKKKNNAVNYISWISVLGFIGGSFALIVILSTLNGFENLILSMYSHFDPDFKIESAEGKMLQESEEIKEILQKTPGLISINDVIEEQAVIKHYENQTAVYVKGVEENYFYNTGLDEYVMEGIPDLKTSGMNLAILGAGVDFKLQTNVDNPQSITSLYTVRRGDYSINDPNILQSLLIKPSGVIYLDDQINQKYIFVPLDFARELFDRENELSFYEIRVEKNRVKEASKFLSEHLGSEFVIKDRIEQQASLYKMFKSEKWVTYALLSFILFLASFNITGSLTMLVIEKKKDVFTFKSMGADRSFIRRIFLTEGILISIIGGIIGLFIGSVLVWAQSQFGLIKMTGAIVENYPVKLLFTDIVLISCTILLLGFITSLYPAWKSFSKE